jgi:hypothetical protein
MPWFVSAKVDTFSILIAGPLVSIMLILAVMQGPAFLIGALLFALLLDLPHVLHTHVRLLANPADYQRNRTQFWGSLILLSIIGIGLGVTQQFVWLVAIWVYWQPYHVCKQHYGVATIYARKSGYQRDTNHILYLMLAGFAAPLLFRMANGGFRFGNYELFGDKLPFAEMVIPTPPIANWAAMVAYAVFAVAIGNFVWREWRNKQDHEQSLSRFVWLMLIVSLSLYNIAYLFVSDLYALILIGTSIHAIQYHLVCVSTVKAVLPIAHTPPESSGSVRWLHSMVVRISATPRLWMVLIGVGVVVLMTEVPSLGIVPLVLALHHFYLDGVIWKRKASK